jgi:hypothetical protein
MRGATGFERERWAERVRVRAKDTDTDTEREKKVLAQYTVRHFTSKRLYECTYERACARSRDIHTWSVLKTSNMERKPPTSSCGHPGTVNCNTPAHTHKTVHSLTMVAGEKFRENALHSERTRALHSERGKLPARAFPSNLA